MELSDPRKGVRIKATADILLLTAIGGVVIWLLLPSDWDVAVRAGLVVLLSILWMAVVILGLQILAALGIYSGFIRIRGRK